jgi:hypothetical protein
LRERLQLFERVVGVDAPIAVELDANQNGALAIIRTRVIRQVQGLPLCESDYPDGSRKPGAIG